MKFLRLTLVSALAALVLMPMPAQAAAKPTTTTLATSASPVTIGVQVTLTATVGGSGNPGGAVNFVNSGSTIGSCTLVSSICSITYTWNSAGTYAITANYIPSTNHSASSSTALNQIITKYSSAVSVVSSKPNAYIGNPLDFTITATGVGATPTGTAILYAYESNTVIGTCTLSAGSCVINLVASTIGNHRVWASYSGDANSYLPSQSAYIYQNNVAKLTPTIVLTHSPTEGDFGTAVTFTATLTGADGTPVGGILFEDSATAIGSCTLTSGICSITTSALTVGTHLITAEFGGDGTYIGGENQITHQVNQVAIATTTSISSSSNPAIEGSSITWTANVSAISGTPDGEIIFKNGSTTLGNCQLSEGHCNYSSSALSVGTVVITAEYSGGDHFLPSSATYSQTINAPSTTATITSMTSSSETLTVGTPVTLTVTVTDTTVVTGTVLFNDGVNQFASCTLSGGSCSAPYTPSVTGSRYITATFVANGAFETSTSMNHYFVAIRPSVLVLTSSANPAPRLTSVTFTAELHTSATGLVIFEDDDVQAGSCTLSVGRCSVTLSFATLGNHVVSAEYGGDALNSAVTTNLTQAIGSTPTTITLLGDNSNAKYYELISYTVTVSDTTATGTVQLRDSATVIKDCTLTLGTCIISHNQFAVGSHQLSAIYSGDATHAGSTSLILTQVIDLGSTSVSVTSDENPFEYGTGLVLSGSVTSAGVNATGIIQFEDYTGAHEVILGTCTLNGTGCSLTLTSALPVGTRKIKAEYSGDTHYSGSISSLYDQVITEGGPIIPPVQKETVTASATIIPVSVLYLEPFVVTAVLTSANGVPTGTVIIEEELSSGSDLILGSCILVAGTCSYSNSTLAVGLHEIYVEYGGTSTFSTAHTAKILVTVTPRPIQSVTAPAQISAPTNRSQLLDPLKPIVALITPTTSAVIDFVQRDALGHSVDVQIVVPAGAVPASATLSIAAVPSMAVGSKDFAALEISILSTEMGLISKLDKPIVLKIAPLGTIAKPATSEDGIRWAAIKEVATSTLGENDVAGFFVGENKMLNVMTLQLSSFDLLKKQYSLYVKTPAASISIGEQVTLDHRGGTGIGALSFSTSTPALCSVSTEGRLLALASGSCVVTAYKAYDSIYFDAISAPRVIRIRP